MKNRLLISGLALGKECDSAICNNVNLQWLFDNSSILLWADKIILTKKVWENCMEGGHVWGDLSKQQENKKAIKLVFEMLKDADLIEIIEPNFSKDIITYIEKTIADDINKASTDTDCCRIKKADKSPFAISILDYNYCIPNLMSIYTGFILSRLYQANPLLTTADALFYQYKFSKTYNTAAFNINKMEAFKEIFNIAIPEIPIFNSHYLFDPIDSCLQCNKYSYCKDNYLLDIEKNIRALLSKRNYDEIHNLAGILNQISSRMFEKEATLHPECFRREFFNEVDKVNKKMKKIFPKIKRWTHLTTAISIPISLSALFSGFPSLSKIAASIAGISSMGDAIVKYCESKYNWINYFNK